MAFDAVTVGSALVDHIYSLSNLPEPDGERMILAGGDAVPALGIDDADLDYLRQSRVVFTSAYDPDEVVSRLVSARNEGTLPSLAFDLSGPLSELDGRTVTGGTLDDALPVLDLLVTSEVPARSYIGVGPREAVEVFRNRGVTRGAVTRGEDGALLFDESGVTDTTGAGDAGEFTAAVAALNCGSEGARSGLPSEPAVEEFR